MSDQYRCKHCSAGNHMSEFWCEATTLEKRHKCPGWDECQEESRAAEAPRTKFFPSNGVEGDVLRGALCDRCRRQGTCSLLERSFFHEGEIEEWTWVPFDLSSIRCAAFEGVLS